MWRIAWSFYAGAVGAWVITGPATYTPWAGVIGNVMYALSSGLPVLMIAYAGPVIQVQGGKRQRWQRGAVAAPT